MRLLRGHAAEILSLAYTADGSAIVSAADDGTVRVWDLASGSERHILRTDRSLGLSVALSPDGKLLAAGGEQRLTLWDAATWTRTAELFEDHFAAPCAHGGDISTVAFSPCGRRLASIGDDGLAKIWDVHTGRKLKTLTGHSGEVLSVAWANDGALLVTGGRDGTLKVWSSKTGTRQFNWKLGSPVWSLAAAVESGLLAAASGRKLRLFPSTLAEEREGISLDDADATCIAIAPRGVVAAVGCDDGSVRFFDLPSRRETAAFGWGLGRMNAMAFAPDGMTIAAGGSSPDVVVWDV